MSWDSFAAAFPIIATPRMRRPSKPKAPCGQGEHLRKLIASIEKRDRKGESTAADRALVEAGKAACIAKCGGCELTREPAPVRRRRKECRRSVLKKLSKAAAPVQAGPFVMTTPDTSTAAFLAARCLACGRCPDMPSVMPQALLGTLPDGATPPPPPAPRM